MKKYLLSAEEYQAVLEAMKVNRDKLVDRRLRVLKYRYEGLSDQQIAEITGYHEKRISQICKEYKEQGLEGYRQVLCANLFTSLAELRLPRAGYLPLITQ